VSLTAPPVQRPPRPQRLQRFKRVVVGAPFATERLAHERLGKATALAVFASDNLSSSAYATEEILRVLVMAGVGVAAFGQVVPITVALLGVLAILLFSYRQTIKAYPQAGGAYLVTRDNFGVMPAQVAGVALLTDYILTVSVSVAAGTAALTSAAPGLFPWRVVLSVGFIALITWGNLRGVRESGKIFAAPTFFFIGMMGVLIAVGFFRMLTGSLHPVHTFPFPNEELRSVSVFLVLHAFSSGGAAVTGVEAISNGVPAFRPPEWLNARTTLMWMGTLLGGMFLGLSVLAAKLHVVPDPKEKVTVLAQIGKAAFGGGGGTAAFLLLQAATVLILVLAANTSFADFPRLASFHAGDSFLPRQFTRYGDRLVFSNGIIALAAFASLLVILFKASVTRLIPLYAIGVFTSFTFSQAGMTRRHLHQKETGWKRGMAINGVGAVVTALMTVIIASTKFFDGAWIVLITSPLILFGLLKVNKHYQQAEKILRDPQRRPHLDVPRQRVVVVGRDGEGDEMYALAYGRRVFPTDLTAVSFAPAGGDGGEFLSRIPRFGEAREVHISKGDLETDLAGYLAELHPTLGPHELLNVIVPETVTERGWRYVIRQHRAQRLKASLLKQPNVVVTNVTLHQGFETLAPGEAAAAQGGWAHVAAVLVSDVHNATLNAVRYAKSLGPDRLHCLHVAVDAEKAKKIEDAWQQAVPGLPLQILQSPYRQISSPIFDWVRTILEQEPGTFITIVLPEFLVRKKWHNLLHNKTALQLKGAFLFEPSVVVSVVPYQL
jgi:amino acid transporter